MVSRQLDFNRIIINDNNLQTFLEANNKPYAEARRLYNLILNNNTNPLTDNGLSTDRLSFIIILLEKTLRNTDIILNQNEFLENKIQILEQDLSEIKQQGLEPIIQAGNNITKELKQFEIGFRNWNNKFDNFNEIFKNWDLGFKNLENNFIKLENFLNTFSKYWEGNITKIETNLKTVETHIVQWNNQVINIHNRLQNIEQNFYNFERKQFPTNIARESTSKQIFRTLPNNNHAFKF